MSKYKVYWNELRSVVVDAESEEKAKELVEEGQFENDVSDGFGNIVTIGELCPDCDELLQDKMINLDGTNLEEMSVCENCGYGYPASYDREKGGEKE